MNYQTPFAVCATIPGFRDLNGDRKGPRPIPNLLVPARNTVNTRTGEGLRIKYTGGGGM